jgi:hypothetical protein
MALVSPGVDASSAVASTARLRPTIFAFGRPHDRWGAVYDLPVCGVKQPLYNAGGVAVSRLG